MDEGFPKEKEGWEKEFDRIFPCELPLNRNFTKHFIRTLRKKDREFVVGELEDIQTVNIDQHLIDKIDTLITKLKEKAND